MKVILQSDIKGTGKKDDVIEVSEGYARNYLFPRKLAVEATSSNLNSIEIKKGAVQHKKDLEKAAAIQLQGNLKDKAVTVTSKGGENGKLFGSVTNKEIADALKIEHNISLDKKKIEAPVIKSAGEYVAEARIYPDVAATFKVIVKTGL